ncbi:glycosyltransferase family 4 protein [Clostridium sp.]|uniref:glycosyltransferase family 4 protein n=1 Tax=Clostridium sp. TaxID=1506 RepID=UPI003D6CD3FE
MKKLVFVTRNMMAGGAERVISQLANNFSRAGIQCTIVTLDNEEIFYQLDRTVKVHTIGRMSSNSYTDKFLKYKQLRLYINHEKPDIVLTLPEEIGIYVIPTLIGTNIPVIVSERNNPWVMPWKKVTRFMRKLFYPFASGFIFQTEQAASFFSLNIRTKGIILPNPLDLERIPEPWEGKRRKEIVGAGRLDKQKNFPLLIRAFSKFYKNHSDYVLTIYGEGSLKKELISLAASLLPKDVYDFPGSTRNLLEQMRGASMFVLSSDYEGMPNVVIEAMAMGMPVISTDCPSGGSAELIDNDKNGLLVQVDDVDALTEAMCKVAESKELSEKLGENAKEIRERLNCNVVAEKWRYYIEFICTKKK